MPKESDEWGIDPEEKEVIESQENEEVQDGPLDNAFFRAEYASPEQLETLRKWKKNDQLPHSFRKERKIEAYRTCQHSGCDTILSRFHPGDIPFCGAHKRTQEAEKWRKVHLSTKQKSETEEE